MQFHIMIEPGDRASMVTATKARFFGMFLIVHV